MNNLEETLFLFFYVLIRGERRFKLMTSASLDVISTKYGVYKERKLRGDSRGLTSKVELAVGDSWVVFQGASLARLSWQREVCG
jgi:hypothetical protein